MSLYTRIQSCKPTNIIQMFKTSYTICRLLFWIHPIFFLSSSYWVLLAVNTDRIIECFFFLLLFNLGYSQYSAKVNVLSTLKYSGLEDTKPGKESSDVMTESV